MARWPLSLEDALAGGRLLWRLPASFRQPIGPDQARAVLRRRLAAREVDFLALARSAIYANPASPYRQLLGLAGCEYGDLQGLVRSAGLEGALERLYRAGVYLTVEEFKGRRPIVRGSARLELEPGRLRNPASTPHVLARSSGSRGAGTAVPLDLASIRERSVNSCLTIGARGGLGWTHSQWGLPGSYVVMTIRYGCFGARMERWFSTVDPASPSLPARYRWSARALRGTAALTGYRLPRLEHVPLEDPLPIVRWLTEVRASGRVPHLYTYVSSAIRVVRAAERAGLDLQDVQLTITGEPITAARLAAIQRLGAKPLPDYGSAEAGGFISYGCLAPTAPDDVHFMHDLHALIQPAEGSSDGLPAGSLLLSSLRPTAALVLLNVSMGDRAVVENRACGCPVERLGWTTHLHTIRSFEKLTAAGMTFLDSDVIRVLEEVLPGRFGGGPTDYQLLEEEGPDGLPRLRLLVHPDVGTLEPATVKEAFFGALGGGQAASRAMELHWRQAGLLTVERRQPLAAASGKTLHLIQGGPARPGLAGTSADSPSRRASLS